MAQETHILDIDTRAEADAEEDDTVVVVQPNEPGTTETIVANNDDEAVEESEPVAVTENDAEEDV